MDNLQLTISSIKIQRFQKIYPIDLAFNTGTIFQELDKPWGHRQS